MNRLRSLNPAALISASLAVIAIVTSRATPIRAETPPPAEAVRLRPESLPRTLHPLSARTSDEAVAADLATIDAWQRQLDTLPGAFKDVWRWASAKAWLDAARIEYEDNDRTGFPQAAFTRAVSLVA